jgi:hypothetical protein
VLWRVMFADHVYTRFTASVDPLHLHPWSFYFTTVLAEFERNGTYWLVLAGLVLLIAQVVKPARSSLVAFVTLAWFLLPVTLMSMVTSKLHHYVYPFLPPLALAAGYAVAWLLRMAGPVLRRALERLAGRTAPMRKRPAVAPILTGIAVLAVCLAVFTAAFGTVRWQVPGIGLFRNSGIERPLFVATLLFVAAGRVPAAFGTAALLLVMMVTPMSAYRRTTAALTHTAHPLKSMRDCLVEARDAEIRAGHPAQAVYAVKPDTWFLHPYFYYLRHAGGWERADSVDDRALAEALTSSPRPVLIDNDDYSAFKARHGASVTAPRMVTTETALLLLPGPYAGCARTYTRQVLY